MIDDFSDYEVGEIIQRGSYVDATFCKIVCVVSFFYFWWYFDSYQIFILFPKLTQHFGFIQFHAGLLFCECLICLIYKFFSLHIWIPFMKFILFGPTETLVCHDILPWFVPEEMLVEDHHITILV